MNIFLVLAFLFFMGSLLGWILELIFRRFVSTANPERKWINPGFCVGPYLPLYGFGLCILFLIALIEKCSWFTGSAGSKAILFIIMALCMTLIEYVAGIICLKILNVRLWDYSSEWCNIQGIICPKFSFFWAVLGAIYYFFIHPHIVDSVNWFVNNLAFSFVVGMFFGVFAIDVVYSSRLIAKLKSFAVENDVIVRYEHLKAHIRSVQERNKQKYRFIFSLQTDRPLSEYLKEQWSSFEKKVKKIKKQK